ncbi:NAD(P)/FAD-dependent oxidoreductase [Corynebacterium sp. MSK006]|uniref:phytoene desaturase family protein n=1 Tax=Corynebacterium sp. MSK006 TaxID=3050187 RepID=UPI00254C9841|nr:NAD(P)/FAD-dependent oxidoreductase [Corynebacterium sp. MSK006]MDK8894269.1 NAD(P)/FAD-dependent oxidoreductase [Corynebacterium sp. MSK006]
MTSSAVVVGSGPNGLAAAVALADAGVRVTLLESAESVGGGLRSGDFLVDGVTHDICSAAHPMLQASPFFHRYRDRLSGLGLSFASPDYDMVHVLDDARSATLFSDLDQMHRGIPDRGDAERWRSGCERLAANADAVAGDFLRPVFGVPSSPRSFAEFGLKAALPASWTWRRYSSDEARALFAGIAAHAFTPLSWPGSSAPGFLIAVVGHRYGWPVAVGGSQSIADAMLRLFLSLGGEFVPGTLVESYEEIQDADVVMLDTSVEAARKILGPRLPSRVERAWSRFRRGPGVAKVDYVIDGDVPWISEPARSAGTVHLGGRAEEVAAAESECWKGRLPDSPFTLVGQQYLADPSRSYVGGGRRLNPLWSYSHVPAGWGGDEKACFELVTSQIERYAPGFRDTIVEFKASPPSRVEEYNPNNIGGDISGGANDLVQLIKRPRVSSDPYFTGVPGVFLCSSSTAPGAGVHFMCGANAARGALKHLHLA